MLKHISVDEARSVIRTTIAPPKPRTVGLVDAVGLTLAEDIIAQHDIPAGPTALMDGFSVNSQEINSNCTEGCPKQFGVTGRVTAGETYDGPIREGFAVRIMTGAELPEGHDAVIPFEDTDTGERHGEIGSIVTYDGILEARMNVRQKGTDMTIGDTLVFEGTIIDPTIIGALGTAGYNSVVAYDAPTIKVFSSGDELVPINEPLEAGQVYNSNIPMLSAAIKAAGGKPVSGGIIKDTLEDTKQALLDAAQSADMIILTGGSAHGDHDFALEALGSAGRIVYTNVNMRPGGTHSFGMIDETPVFLLPGTPGGALIVSSVLVNEAIDHMRGSQEESLSFQNARVENPKNLASKNKRGIQRGQKDRPLKKFMRGWYFVSTAGIPSVRVLDKAKDHRLAELQPSNCIIEVDEAKLELEENIRVTCIPTAFGGGFSWM